MAGRHSRIRAFSARDNGRRVWPSTVFDRSPGCYACYRVSPWDGRGRAERRLAPSWRLTAKGGPVDWAGCRSSCMTETLNDISRHTQPSRRRVRGGDRPQIYEQQRMRGTGRCRVYYSHSLHAAIYVLDHSDHFIPSNP